ncbi:MAG: DUF1223 domain-containing protein [Gammaproteobacteria bacterium]|nr:DUF1223 domain-containing protein [Gammaproteobacteria bacterium]
MRTSLLELFTSEGCSSCPPADRWLSGLRAQTGTPQRLVPLAFHVDYWNQLGWVDRFAKPAYSTRQYWIAGVTRARTVYTPQFVLDGRDWRPARTGYPEARNDREAAAQLHLELRPADAGRLEVRGEALLRTPREDAQVFLALYENNLTSRIEAGENAGKLLRHDYVVRELVGPFRLPASGASAFQHRFILGTDWKRDDLGVSAFVQNAATAEVFQALQRPACKSQGNF